MISPERFGWPVRRRRSPLAVTAGLFVVIAVPAVGMEAGESRVELGVEQFDWREYGENGDRSLLETGMRLAFGFEHRGRVVGKGGAFGVLVRGYFGNVAYKGYLQYVGGHSTPYSTRTHYWGGVVEPRYIFRVPFSSKGLSLSFIFGAGGEWWLRDLRGEYGYREYYDVGYVRLEAGMEEQTNGWFGRVGMKSPFLLRERISGFYLDGACSDVSLSPGKNNTTVVSIGYRFRSQSVLSLNYDAYLLSPSPGRRVRCENNAALEIYQPKSEMRLISIRYSIPLPRP